MKLKSTNIPKQTSQLIQNLINLDTSLTYFLSKYSEKDVYKFINKLYNVLLNEDLEDIASDLYLLKRIATDTSRYNSTVVTYILNYQLSFSNINTIPEQMVESEFPEVNDQIAYKYFVEGFTASEIAEMYLLAMPTVYKHLSSYVVGVSGGLF